MARVFQRSPAQEWWLDYEDAQGRRHQKRIHAASKQVAESLLADVLELIRLRSAISKLHEPSRAKAQGANA